MCNLCGHRTVENDSQLSLHISDGNRSTSHSVCLCVLGGILLKIEICEEAPVAIKLSYNLNFDKVISLLNIQKLPTGTKCLFGIQVF